eukprot:5943715-Prymnesium_polylepis.1
MSSRSVAVPCSSTDAVPSYLITASTIAWRGVERCDRDVSGATEVWRGATRGLSGTGARIRVAVSVAGRNPASWVLLRPVRAGRLLTCIAPASIACALRSLSRASVPMITFWARTREGRRVGFWEVQGRDAG